jgi:hypothetical protein
MHPPGLGHYSLKSWLVETSADGERWWELAHEESNKHLNSFRFTRTFAVAGGGACRFIRLVNIGKNYHGSDNLCISGWEIFGALFELADSSDVAFAFRPHRGKRDPVNRPRPWSSLGAIAPPVAGPPLRNDGNPCGLGDPLQPPHISAFGFRLVSVM